MELSCAGTWSGVAVEVVASGELRRAGLGRLFAFSEPPTWAVAPLQLGIRKRRWRRSHGHGLPRPRPFASVSVALIHRQACPLTSTRSRRRKLRRRGLLALCAPASLARQRLSFELVPARPCSLRAFGSSRAAPWILDVPGVPERRPCHLATWPTGLRPSGERSQRLRFGCRVAPQLVRPKASAGRSDPPCTARTTLPGSASPGGSCFRFS